MILCMNWCLPSDIIMKIFLYDPTYHREQYNKILEELLIEAPVWISTMRQKYLYNSATIGVEIKEAYP